MALLFDLFVAALVLACTCFEVQMYGWRNVVSPKKRRPGAAEREQPLWVWLYWLAAVLFRACALTVRACASRLCGEAYRVVAEPSAANRNVAAVRLAVETLVFWRMLVALRLAGVFVAASWLACRVAYALTVDAASLAWRWLF